MQLRRRGVRFIGPPMNLTAPGRPRLAAVPTAP